VSKSIRLSGCNVLTLVCFLLVAALFAGSAFGQSQRGRAAIYGIGPGNTPLLNQPSPATGTPVWVDTQAKTFIEAWTEYDQFKCVDISPGSFTILTAPTHGQLFFDVELHTLGNGDCPGVMFHFAVARYTWTDAERSVLQDPFTLNWSTPDGKFSIDEDWIAELAKITQAKSVWWICGVTRMTLPRSVTLKLTNPPSGAASFDWTVSAGSDKLVFSNGTPTITTAANSATVKSLAASTAKKDVSVNVNVQGLSYDFMTDVRSPHQLKRRPDMDHDNGRGADCTMPGNQGWQSLVAYEVDDQFGVNTSSPDNGNAGINEKLGRKTDFQPNNWPMLTEGGSDTLGGLFSDYLCVTGVGNPNPTPPQSPLSTNKVDRFPQTWFAGDSTSPADHKGCKVQTDNILRFIDHGRHTNIVSPPAAPAESDGQATAAGSATGYPMPVPNVRYLEEQSTLIVKGRVLTVNALGSVEKPTDNGALTLQQMTASVQIDSVLKGTLGGGVVNVGFLRNPDVLATTLDENEYALLFLTRAADGRYTFADPQVGKMPITSRNVPFAGKAQTTAGKIEAVLFASLSDPNREVARAALVQVANLGSVQSTQPIRNIATAGDPEFQGLAYVALVRLGDYSQLTQAIRYAEHPSQDLQAQRQQFGVAEAIGDIQNRSELPALNSLLASQSVILRRAAAKALRGMSDPSSASSLVRALADKDADVQYDVVMGLAAIAGGTVENAPARDIFNQDPAKYVAYWKNWWQSSNKGK
jgi:HEAT repeats